MLSFRISTGPYPTQVITLVNHGRETEIKIGVLHNHYLILLDRTTIVAIDHPTEEHHRDLFLPLGQKRIDFLTPPMVDLTALWQCMHHLTQLSYLFHSTLRHLPVKKTCVLSGEKFYGPPGSTSLGQ